MTIATGMCEGNYPTEMVGVAESREQLSSSEERVGYCPAQINTDGRFLWTRLAAAKTVSTGMLPVIQPPTPGLGSSERSRPAACTRK